MQIEHILQEIPLFSPISADHLRGLVEQGQVVQLDKDQTVFSEGESGQDFQARSRR
jgi:hypothetical protein